MFLYQFKLTSSHDTLQEVCKLSWQLCQQTQMAELWRVYSLYFWEFVWPVYMTFSNKQHAALNGIRLNLQKSF